MFSNIPDLNKIKGFCEDIFRIMDKLELGECSLKGYVAHKLYHVRQKLKNCPESSTNDNHDQTGSVSVQP